ncbi:MAG: hypothetical protein WAK29_02280, partial [Terriglobales bacterium]
MKGFWAGNYQIGTIRDFSGTWKFILDNRGGGSTIKVSPPIPVRIEWADSQGNVTASWLAAHFDFLQTSSQKNVSDTGSTR